VARATPEIEREARAAQVRARIAKSVFMVVLRRQSSSSII
jgi:hypothetical protein